ncbi:MAG: hypothetical protein ACI4PU_04505, partial [Intestinibacter sp.]
MGKLVKTMALITAIGAITVTAFVSKNDEIKGQVDNLRNIALGLKQEIGYYQKDVDNLQAEKESLTQQVSDLTTQKESLEAEVATKTDNIQKILMLFGKSDATGNEDIDEIGTVIEAGVSRIVENNFQDVIDLLELKPADGADSVTKDQILNAITDLKNQVDDLNSQIGTLNETIATLNTQISSLQTEIDTAEKDAESAKTDLESKVNAMNSDLNKANTEEEEQLQYIKDA